MATVIHHLTTTITAAAATATAAPSSPPSLISARTPTSPFLFNNPSKSTPDFPTSALSFLPPTTSIPKPDNFLPNRRRSSSKIPIPEPQFIPHPVNEPPVSKNSDPRGIDYSNLLRLSVRYGDIELARALHVSILKNEVDVYLYNALIVAYLKLGYVDCAFSVFRSIHIPDAVSYSAMISGFAKSSREIEAVELFFEMRRSGIEPNEYGFVAILTACIRLIDFELGSQVHAILIKSDCSDCTYVVNALMGLYSKCGCLDYVVELFAKMPQRDIASWNTMISGLVKESMYDRAFKLFSDMLKVDVFKMDCFTVSTLLAASSSCSARRVGYELHTYALKSGFELNLSVNNSLIGFYAKCGTIRDVGALFERMIVKDVVTWTEIITAYMEFGRVDLALDIFNRMPEKNGISCNALLAGFCHNDDGLSALRLFCRMMEEGVEMSDFTLTSVLNACGLIKERSMSEQIHGFLLKCGSGSNDHTEMALIDMCTRCGRMADAEKLFRSRPLNQGHPIVLTSMVCGYARNGQLDEAVTLFCQRQSLDPMIMDEHASAAVLSLCGTLGFHGLGQQVHCHAVKCGFLSDIGVNNAMISMYYKCGSLKDASRVFDVMPRRDIVSWNSLLASHILHREGDEALAIWAKMEKLGMEPDSVTCFHIISAYGHTRSNLTDCCYRFFFAMKSRYQIEPNSEHYSSMVGVLGFWGMLEEAEKMIKNMPFEPPVSVWRALLDGCRIHSDTAIGQRAVKKILSLDPQDPSTSILKSNLYSASGRWHCSDLVREDMRKKGLRKIPGQSWIIHENMVHSFFARDRSHSQSKDIYSGLEILILECLKAGYVPDTSFVLHEVEEHQKKDFLFYHSSKLAVTYGLLMTRPGKPVCVMKNIVLCGDCHAFFKYVSVVTKREIHVRDASGFHCFSDGMCSCKDYWS